MPRLTDTIAALATPVGTSALAILRISGPDTLAICQAIFDEAPSPRLATHADYRDQQGALLDDVVVTFFAGPKSYTGEDALEISCHGNPFIAQKILEDLLARGCRAAEPGEFTQRAFLTGRLDLSQAEAVMDVIHARSERALATARRQLQGELGQRMQELVERLLGVLARVEAYIDFPDEDLPPEDRGWVLNELQELTTGTSRLLATRHYGELLRDGIKTVIVGAPNAGKSSLLNRLVGKDRALVSPEPGTTRDFIEERIIVGPHCLRIIDTAGLNPSPARLEKLGIEKTFERMEEADLLLLVLDASQPIPAWPEKLRQVSSEKRVLVIWNKSDLPRAVSEQALPKPHPEVRISALTGAGLEELTKAVIHLADSLRPESGEDGVAINARHAGALTHAQAGLNAAVEKIRTQGPVELLASDLRGVLSAYGEISGRVDNERMLDHLFATFCIGK